jgi:hypothetical protein
MAYRDLKKITKGLGLEAHHLIEKRFADIIGVKANDILSIGIDKCLAPRRMSQSLPTLLAD